MYCGPRDIPFEGRLATTESQASSLMLPLPQPGAGRTDVFPPLHSPFGLTMGREELACLLPFGWER